MLDPWLIYDGFVLTIAVLFPLESYVPKCEGNEMWWIRRIRKFVKSAAARDAIFFWPISGLRRHSVVSLSVGFGPMTNNEHVNGRGSSEICGYPLGRGSRRGIGGGDVRQLWGNTKQIEGNLLVGSVWGSGGERRHRREGHDWFRRFKNARAFNGRVFEGVKKYGEKSAAVSRALRPFRLSAESDGILSSSRPATAKRRGG